MFITAVLTRLKFELFLPGEYIVRMGCKGDRMYFIQRGVVEVITDDGTIVTHLSEGAHFGEICLLTDDRRVATIKSTTMCDLFSLSKQNFKELLEEFPEMRPFFETIANKRLCKIGRIPDNDDNGSPPSCAGVGGYSSVCSIHDEYSESAKYTPARSLSPALEHEASGSARRPASAKDASYKKLPPSKTYVASTSSSPERLGEEEYAQRIPHFVSHDKSTT